MEPHKLDSIEACGWGGAGRLRMGAWLRRVWPWGRCCRGCAARRRGGLVVVACSRRCNSTRHAASPADGRLPTALHAASTPRFVAAGVQPRRTVGRHERANRFGLLLWRCESRRLVAASAADDQRRSPLSRGSFSSIGGTPLVASLLATPAGEAAARVSARVTQERPAAASVVRPDADAGAAGCLGFQRLSPSRWPSRYASAAT